MDDADACPFCASEALAYALMMPRGGYIFCCRCHAYGPRGRTQSEAVVLWNRALVAASPAGGSAMKKDKPSRGGGLKAAAATLPANESTGGAALPRRRRSGPVTDDDLIDAASDANELVASLFRTSDGDAQRTVFVLCVSLRLVHAALQAEGRALVEDRVRRVLGAMYEQAPHAEGHHVEIKLV